MRTLEDIGTEVSVEDVLQIVKRGFISLAIDDKLPLDMNELDMYEVLRRGDHDIT